MSTEKISVSDKENCVNMETVAAADVSYKILDDYVRPPKAPPQSVQYYRYVKPTPEELDSRVEYDMDEEDMAWLELVNEQRTKGSLSCVSYDQFEALMDRFEKECFYQCQMPKDFKNLSPEMEEFAVCAVCLDGKCTPDNLIIFCDMCSLAVHQKCYGILFIPEIMWVCHRCLHSPSKAVDCVLCPNKTGAFKQLPDARWVHMTCAMWLPEVKFLYQNALEPIVGIDQIAPARWKLACYICKQKGSGACIQCNHPSCYEAFHATCAQQAGLSMKCEVIKDGDTVTEKKTVLCDLHSQPGSSNDTARSLGSDSEDDENVEGQSERKQKLAAVRRTLADCRNYFQPLFIPVITVNSIAKITRRAREVEVEKGDAFVGRLHCFWTLKRQSRNGYPILNSRKYGERLKIINVNLNQQPHELSDDEKESIEQEVNSKPKVEESFKTNLRYCHQLRQDLEKVRLLIEQVRKREKFKMEQLKLRELQFHLELEPLQIIMTRTLDRLTEFDVITNSSEESTVGEDGSRSVTFKYMKQKVHSRDYSVLDEFTADFEAMIKSCVKHRGTKHSDDLKSKANNILKEMHQEVERVGFDKQTGLHSDPSKKQPAEVLVGHSNKPETERRDTVSAAIEETEPPAKQTSVSKPQNLPNKGVESAKVGHMGRGRPRKKPLNSESDTNDLTPTKPVGGSRNPPEAKESIETKTPPSASTSTSGVSRRNTVLLNTKSTKSSKHVPVATSEPKDDVETVKDPKKSLKKRGRPPKNSEARVSRDSDESPKVGGESKKRRLSHLNSEKEQRDKDGRKTGVRWFSPTPVTNMLTEINTSKDSFIQFRDSSAPRNSPHPEGFPPPPSQVRSQTEAEMKESFKQYRNLSSSNSDTEMHSSGDESSSSSSHSDDDDDDDDSSSSQGSSSEESNNDDLNVSDDDSAVRDNTIVSLQPFDLVWAKCHGFPWYPALVVDPKMPKNDAIQIPAIPEKTLKEASPALTLVLFFDAKQTWQWLPLNKLNRLGVDLAVDKAKLLDNKKPNIRKVVQSAYDKALQQKRLILAAASVEGQSKSTTQSSRMSSDNQSKGHEDQTPSKSSKERGSSSHGKKERMTDQ